MSLLAIGLNDVRIIGAWGMGVLVRLLLLELFMTRFLMNLKVVVLSLMLGVNLENVLYFHYNKNLFVRFDG